MFDNSFSSLEIDRTGFHSRHFRTDFFDQEFARIAMGSFNGNYCFHVTYATTSNVPGPAMPMLQVKVILPSFCGVNSMVFISFFGSRSRIPNLGTLMTPAHPWAFRPSILHSTGTPFLIVNLSGR